jgi:Domain of unknown function (DUF4287)/Domain of unknown function (DUF5655)
MSFSAYLDTIKEKTGLDPVDFRRIAEEKGLLADGVKTGAIVDWITTDYPLGRGHAMAIVATLKPTRAQDKHEDPISAYFSGAKAGWRSVFDDLLVTLEAVGPVTVSPTNSYLSLLRDSRKFAIVAATRERLDIGIKLPGVEPTERFAAAGSWNSMVTHRVRVTDADQVDTQLLNWLSDAYATA